MYTLHRFHSHCKNITPVQRKPFFLQTQRFETQFVLHLYKLSSTIASGAGGLSVGTGTNLLSVKLHP